MVDLLVLARGAAVLSFAALAVVALLRLPRSGAAGRWVAGAFGALALALTQGHLEPSLGVALPGWLDTGRVLLLVAFPYLLLRFTASFRPLPRWLEAVAGLALAVVVAAVAVAAPDVSAVPWLVPLALAYWVLVSLVTITRLWWAGEGQPTVARRRMRLMSAATAVLAVALVLAVNPPGAGLSELLVQLAALASGLTFGLGFAPPRAIRLVWRRTEEEQLQRATMTVLRTTDVEEVADDLLGPTAAIVGAGRAALLDATGRVISRVGEVREDVIGHSGAAARVVTDESRQVIPLGEERGQLVVWTTPYTPFFARDEIELLQAMGAVATLALERCELVAEERTHRAVLEEARRDAEEARSEAEAANLAKSEFLSRMSHELRTPLNAILGFGQLLEAAELDEDDAQAAAQILKAGRHLLALIDDVLDLSRIESGTLAISLEPVHTVELLDDAIALVRPRADERSIRFETDRDSCDSYVMTDRQRCRQVLLNLLSNAVKYNHDGGEVRIRCSRPSEETLRIAVEDTGPGIEPARQAQLFDPFERLGAESSQIEGTGLGLALARRLMEHLGGRIDVESVPRQGSTFWIDLPVTEEPAQRDRPSEGHSAPADTTDERSLLLVEDNLANLRVVEATLQRFRPNISVIPAMQGRLAIDLATQHMPDVIVLDLHLPDLSGREVLGRLQADRRTRDIPVVIASAEARPSHVRQLLDEGAFDYVTKPFDLHGVLDVIDAALAPPGGAADGEPDGGASNAPA